MRHGVIVENSSFEACNGASYRQLGNLVTVHQRHEAFKEKKVRNE